MYPAKPDLKEIVKGGKLGRSMIVNDLLRTQAALK